MILDLDHMHTSLSVSPNRRGRFWSAFLCLALISGESSCAAWNARQDRLARERHYQTQLASLHFPTSRKELFRVLPPAGESTSGFYLGTPATAIEQYRLDADFFVLVTHGQFDRTGRALDSSKIIDALIKGKSSGSIVVPNDTVVSASIERVKH